MQRSQTLRKFNLNHTHQFVSYLTDFSVLLLENQSVFDTICLDFVQGLIFKWARRFGSRLLPASNKELPNLVDTFQRATVSHWGSVTDSTPG